MSKQIWKYALNINETKLEMPDQAMVLSVGTQSDNIYLWALVDTELANTIRIFYTRGTGWDIEKPVEYLFPIGTVQMQSGLVFHVFEEDGCGVLDC